MSNASQRRQARRKTTPIDNSPVEILEDEDVDVVPTEEAVPQEAEEATTPPATILDFLIDLAKTIKTIKQQGVSEGGAIKLTEVGLMYLSNKRANDLQEFAMLREARNPMPWDVPPVPPSEGEEVTEDDQAD